jgi:pimeloyl-ACP methyl ester carboxylesterase
MSRRIAAIVLGLVLAAFVGVGPSAAPAAAATCDTFGLGKKLPVLLVHGFLSSGNTWSTGLYKRGGALPGVPGTFITETFDYASQATEWIQNNPKSTAAQRLAERIQCLAQASSKEGGPGRVVLVGHSLGGLVIRCALSPKCSHGPAVAAVAGQVVTIGTPSLGSFLRPNGVVSAALTAYGRVLQAQCALLDSASKLPGRVAEALVNAWVTQPLCRIFTGLFSSSAGQAFTLGSQQLKDLPLWPKDHPVRTIAASTDFSYQVIAWEAASINVGDGVVGVDSASATFGPHPLGGARIRDCGDLRFTSTFWSPDPSLTAVPNCHHITETGDKDISTMVGQAVGAWKDAMYRPLSAADLQSAPVPALCEFPAGKLVDGQLPGQPVSAGHPPTLVTTALDGAGAELVALGDLDLNGRGDAAAVVNCNAGGVGWPDNIVFWSAGPTGPTVLGAYQMGDAVGDARNGTTKLTYQSDGSVVVDSLDAREFDFGCCVTGRARVTLKWDGQHVVATDVQRLSGPYEVTFSGIGQVHLGMTARDLEGLGYRPGEGNYNGCVSYTAGGNDPVATYHPGQDAVVKVSAWGQYVHTPNGLQAGSSLDDVRSTYADKTIEEHLDSSMGQGASGLLVGDRSGGWISFLTDDGNAVSDILVSDHEHYGAREAGCE